MNNESIAFPYRAHKRIINGYKGRPIDFLKRAISKNLYELYPGESDKIILEYLVERSTKTKKLLLEKAIIGLFSDEIFGKVIWRGEL